MSGSLECYCCLERAIPARLFDFNGLSKVLNITGPIFLDSKGRTRFYGGNLQTFRRLQLHVS